MTKAKQQPAQTVQADWLKPFAPIAILRCLASNPAPAVEQLLTFLRERVTDNKRSETIILASGFAEDTTESLQQEDDAARVDQLLGFVYQRSSVPGWAQVDAAPTGT